MMLNVLIYGWKDIQLVNEDGCCVATYESIETAKRAKALWNMAERLGLSTEEIESDNVETKLNAAPDMLEAIEEVVAITENLPVCPFCGCALDHRPDCLSHKIDAALRKARGLIDSTPAKQPEDSANTDGGAATRID